MPRDTILSRSSRMMRCAALTGYAYYHHHIKDLKIENPHFSAAQCQELESLILQACHIKISKTEFISCPSCGRTQYDIQSVLSLVKQRFPNYPGLKIGVMGCIVNGPGEMADADYGYVGAARGKVSLYRKKECIEKNIPSEQAVERLLELINSDLQ